MVDMDACHLDLECEHLQTSVKKFEFANISRKRIQNTRVTDKETQNFSLTIITEEIKFLIFFVFFQSSLSSLLTIYCLSISNRRNVSKTHQFNKITKI